MSWSRWEGDRWRLREIRRATHQARELYPYLWSYSADNGTDGLLTIDDVGDVCHMIDLPLSAIDDLYRCGLVERREHDFYLVGYLDTNPTAQEMDEVRQKRAEAGRRGGQRSGESRRSKIEANASASAAPFDLANAQAKMKHDTIRNDNDTKRYNQPARRAREEEPLEDESGSGLAGLGLQPLSNDSTTGEGTELQAMWRTVHAVTAILDDPAPSDEELGNYFVGVQENWYYNGTSRPADLLAVAREQRAGTNWPPTSKSAQFRVYARNRTGRGDLNPRPKAKSSQNGHSRPVPASNPAWNDRPADTWHDPEADRLHALTMARMGIDENGNEIPPVPDQKGPAA